MGIAYNPSAVGSGLVFLVDAGNPNSYGSNVPPSTLSQVEVLVVAGGGAGGAGEGNTNGGGGGGGGGGGVVYSSSFPVTANTNYTVTVGAGGLSNLISQSVGANGQDSIFGSLVAIGGGGGGGGDLEGLVPASSGGSGGGAGGDSGTESRALGTTGQGNSGGARNSPNNNRAGAGGGGAGQAGFSGTVGISNTGLGGTGGNGVSYDISGTPTFYGGGGGGGSSVNFSTGLASSSTGGLGGGGAGGGSTVPFSGTNFTGGGGGGGFGGAGGSGGSGIVIVRYPGGPKAGGGTITSVAGNTIHTFTTSGTFSTFSDPAWRDIVGQRTGDCVNLPSFNSANGGSLILNGIAQFVNFGSDAALNVGNIITVNAWFFVNSNASYQPIVAKNNSGGTLGWEMANSSGAFRATLRPTATQINVAAGALTVGVWYMGTMTFDGTTMRLYLNGVETGSGTGGPVTLNSPESLLIGARANGLDYYNGRVAQVSIYNRVLSAIEIEQNFNSLRGRFGI